MRKTLSVLKTAAVIGGPIIAVLAWQLPVTQSDAEQLETRTPDNINTEKAYEGDYQLETNEVDPDAGLKYKEDGHAREPNRNPEIFQECSGPSSNCNINSIGQVKNLTISQ